ncbi:ABC transporter permease [Candidatus Methylocalor cossyra]|uniref:ABC transporter ATP-binding protein n=1 Tax=Candidatus Methylocalor cossyra TaxID=3108543 RepID=A0ABM9NJG1_9GAMM
MGFLVQLVVRNIARQKLRNLLTGLGIVIAVVAFGLLRTVVDAWYAGVESSSSSRLVVRHAVSLAFALPIRYQQRIRQVEGVTGVTHASWFGGVYIDEKNFFPQFAIDPTTYFDLLPELELKPEEKAAFLHDRKGAMVGRKTAARFGWKVGDSVPLRGTIYPGNWSFVIRGIYSGKTRGVDETTFFFHYDYLNEYLRQEGDARADQVGLFFVGIDRPDHAAQVSAAIDQAFKNSLAETLTETEKAFQLSFVAMTEAIVVAVEIVSYVIIVIIMAVMANTMAMTARERMREYATLKAMGFGPGYLAALISGESLGIALSAGAIGIIATFPVVRAMGDLLVAVFPVFLLGRRTIWMALAAVAVIGWVAAVFPAIKAARVSVSDGLRSMG